MKFNIAAKLGVLAAVVSLAATAVVGFWSLGQARSVLTERELGDLTNETELRVYELMNDFRYLRKDVRELANPPARRGKASDIKTLHWVEELTGGEHGDEAIPEARQEQARAQLRAACRKLLEKEENYYYLELCCVRIDASQEGEKRYAPLLAVGRRRSGPASADLAAPGLLTLQQKESLRILFRDAVSTRVPRLQMFPVQAHQFEPAAARDGVTPMLLTVAFPIDRQTTGMPRAMLLLTVDFEEFVQFRARHLPRHLVWLASEAGRLLIHPDPDRQHELRVASCGGPTGLPHVRDATPLNSFAEQFERKKPWEQQELRQQRGDEQRRVALDDVAFYYAAQRLERPADREKMRENWEALRDRLEGLAKEYPELRFQVPSATATALQISHPDRSTLDAVEKELLVVQRDNGWEAPAWPKPVRCSHFAVRFMLLNPDLDARDKLRLDPTPTEERPRFFGLALGTGLEEIQHDISQATSWMIWVVLGLGAGAALVAWLFSRMLTRPLGRIIRATQHVAAASVDGELPESLPVNARDEIGILARSFESMHEQLRKRREALVENVARMRAILDTAAEGVVVFDDHGRIESFNQAAEQIFGYRAEEIHGQKVDRLLDVEKPAASPSSRAGAVATSGSLVGRTSGGPTSEPLVATASDSVRMVSQVLRKRGEAVGRRKDGSTFPAEVAFSEVPLKGRTVVTGIFRDITERKKAEEQIRRANEELDGRVRLRTFELEDAKGKLEAALQGALDATRAKDAFLASMSHELRTPLNAIIGYTELLMDSAGDDGYEGIVPDLVKIHTAGKHLLDLINDILDLSKIAAGQMKLNLTDFELGPLLESVRGMGHPLAQKYGNRLIFEAAPVLGKVHADEKRVRQVLLNLLSNACKFTDKGQVSVRAWREPPREEIRNLKAEIRNPNEVGTATIRTPLSPNDTIVLQVSDSGIGMTPDQLRRLGELFYQADASNTKRKGGTGLGMAITKNFVRMMHGTIEAQSLPGKGTTFTVRLPAVVSSAPAPSAVGAEQEAELEAAASGPRDLVLVVDDDPEARDLIERYLVKEGLRVHVAAEGKNVLELAKQLRPVAITLDVQMPGLDGWTLLAALKTDPATADIPVIMLTIDDNARRGFALGASDYLTKPIDWPRLAGVLHRYCRAVEGAPVLVVEDDPVNRELVCRMLQREGRGAVPAENGRVALARLDEGLRPALILLDLMMPEMDGFQFIEELRRRPALQGIPVVVVTAKELTADDRLRLNGSVAQILSKGAFSPEHLLEQLRTRVHQHLHAAGAVGATR